MSDAQGLMAVVRPRRQMVPPSRVPRTVPATKPHSATNRQLIAPIIAVKKQNSKAIRKHIAPKITLALMQNSVAMQWRTAMATVAHNRGRRAFMRNSRAMHAVKERIAAKAMALASVAPADQLIAHPT